MRANKFLSNHKTGFPDETQIVKFSSKNFQVEIAQRNYYQDVRIELQNESNFKSASIVKHRGVIYKNDGLYLTSVDDDCVKLYEIIEFIFINEICHVVLRRHALSPFDNHFQCYFVNSAFTNYDLRKISEFKMLPITIHTLFNNKKAIRIKVI
jgi:hypothetical protein